MIRFVIAIALCLASPAQSAEKAMSAEGFDAYSRGKTFYYGYGGAPYGAEEYLDDRRVRWSFLDGKCREGYWYEEAGNICFVYEDNPVPQCWSFYSSGGGLVARYENEPDLPEFYEMRQTEEPMMCLGPDVGV